MFGLGDNNEEDQKFWNLLMFKVYASDKELESYAPWALLVVAVIVTLVVIFT